MNPDIHFSHARQFTRHAARFQARIEPHPDHADQFRLAFPDGRSGLAVTDVSKGGLGLITGFLVPRNIRLLVTIDASTLPGGRSLTVRTVTRRCVLSDHKPSYQIGLQFLETDGEDERLLFNLASENKAEFSTDAKSVGR